MLNRLGLTQLNTVKFAAECHHKKLPAKPPVVLASDLDETFFDWEERDIQPNALLLDKTKKLLKAEKQRLTFIPITGRSLSGIHVLAQHFRDVAVKWLSLNNGQELYHNANYEDAPTWISKLTLADQDKDWQRHLENVTGWRLDKVMDTFRQEIKAAGYVFANRAGSRRNERYMKISKDGHLMRVMIVPDHSALNFHTGAEKLSPVDLREANRLKLRILKALKAQGMAVDITPVRGQWAARRLVLPPDMQPNVQSDIKNASGLPITTDHHTQPGPTNPDDAVAVHQDSHQGDTMENIQFWFAPAGVNKARSLAFLLREKLAKPKALITAGDHEYNDDQLLKRTSYTARDGQSVDNYPVQSGTRPAVAKLLKRHPRQTQTPTGDLAPAIAKQLAKIDAKTSK